SGPTTMDILLAHATEGPPLFADIGAANWVPTTIEAVVQACLAKDPGDRPQSARDLAERYETALAHEEAVRDGGAVPESYPNPEEGPAESAAAPAPPAVDEASDPNSVVHQLEAWMPEKIAAYKLRGFVSDVGGEVVESVPGLIRVRLGGPG